MRPDREGADRAGPHDHPARRRHRLYGRGDPARPALRGREHREAGRDRRHRVAPAARPRGSRSCHPLRRGARDQARDGGGRGAGARIRRRSHFGRRVLHRRQRRHERGRQEGRAVGHRARQPRQLAHGHARRRLARGRAPRAQSRAHPRRADGALPHPALRGRRQDPEERGDAGSRRQAPAQGRPGQGRHRQVARRRARRAKGGLRRAHHLRDLHPPSHAEARAHRMPGILRRREEGGALDRRDQELPGPASEGDPRGPRAPRRALREGRRLCHQGEEPRPPAHDPAGRHRERRRECRRRSRIARGAHRQRARRRGFHCDDLGTAQALLARPRSHRGHLQAHQRLQDQRGRGDPARSPRRLHRGHRAHQHRVLDRQQARPRGEAEGVLRRRRAHGAHRREDRREGAHRRPPGAGARAPRPDGEALEAHPRQPRPRRLASAHRPRAAGARARRDRARRPGIDPLLARAAAPAAHLVEGGAARCAPPDFFRARLRAHHGGDRRDPRRRAARTCVRSPRWSTSRPRS